MNEAATFSWAIFLRRYGVVIALALLFCAVALESPAFLEVNNLLNILGQWTPVGIMAVGMTFVIIAGGFDLSITPGFALCAVIAAFLGRAGLPPSAAFGAAIVFGALIGVFNATLVCVLDLNPFISTLSVGFILSSLPFVIFQSASIQVEADGFDALGTGSFLGVPYSVIVLAGFLLVGGLVLSRTIYGQWVYAVGGNEQVSRLFGVPVKLVIASTYVLSGICMGTAADISTSQLSYSVPEPDPAMVFDVIVAVVVGGTSLSGGFGSMWRTAAGLAILATLQNGLNLLQINTFYQYIAKGSIIILALSLDVIARLLANASERRTKRARDTKSQPAHLSLGRR